jgi:hypothetical protein
MSLRKIIRENIENITGTNQLFDIDGFEFVNKKTDKNNNILWKYSKSIKSGSSNRKDNDYIFNVFIAKTPNENWYYKFFVYWKTHTSDFTSGKGKDFDLQFGPFDSLEAMEKDAGIPIASLRVDGGMVVNQLLMQFQSDIIGEEVICPKIIETTALGAAYAAGLAVGYWESLDDLRKNWGIAHTWKPGMESEKRMHYRKQWKKAVTKTFDWED